MRVLVLNCGSSSLKFDLVLAGSPGAADDLGGLPTLASGAVESIGPDATISTRLGDDVRSRVGVAAADHAEAAQAVLDWLRQMDPLGLELDVVAHRVVHGGERYVEPTEIDDALVGGLEDLASLAPLHNGPTLAVIHATREALGPDVTMVAVFDTAFHRTLPPHAATYALPSDIVARHGIRRYGFHGIAHRALAQRWAMRSGRSLQGSRLITLQLGSGASAAAIADGRSVDTTMGFTPLEGLVMGTRSGDIDPGIPGWLMRREGIDVDQLDELLNHRSGLLGISGRSADMADLLVAEAEGDPAASLAVEVFCYRVRKQIGAYLAVLGGADAVVFGGGIGERSPAVRARICAGLAWCGIAVDSTRNDIALGTDLDISTDDATTSVWVIAGDEASVIAGDAVRCLATRRPPRRGSPST